MALIQQPINSIGELLTFLPTVFGTGRRKKFVWFRGQGCEDWKLLPSIMRPPNKVDNEMILMKRFKQHSFPFLDRIPQVEWEWLFIMQHYGVQTRLLDWSESPLVGLYFALEILKNAADRRKDSALWCLYPIELNKIANVTLTTSNDIPFFGDDIVLEKYLPSRVIGINDATPTPLAIIAPRQFKRLYAQQGVFTIFHRNTTGIEDLGNQSHIIKIIISNAAKDTLRKELDYLMINELALFPELEKVGKRVYELNI